MDEKSNGELTAFDHARGSESPESASGMHALSRRRFMLQAVLLGLLAAQGEMVSAEPGTFRIPYRTLGATNEKISCIGIGGYHIGVPSESEGVEIIRTALDSGVNFLDNCWDYNKGLSEERMGRALQNGYRKKAFLMSKLDGRDKATATKQLDDSLRRLQTDVIDLMQIHEVIRFSDPEICFAPGGVIEALVEAKKAGKIRYIGFTGHKSPEMHLKMLETAKKNGFRFDAVQMPLNVMDAHYNSFERKVLPVLVKENIGVLGMKPLANGAILECGAVTAPECLHYAMSLRTSVVITGCDSMRILKQALKAASDFKPLSDQDMVAMLKKTEPFSGAGKLEMYKNSTIYDGTTKHPEWLGHV